MARAEVQLVELSFGCCVAPLHGKPFGPTDSTRVSLSLPTRGGPHPAIQKQRPRFFFSAAGALESP